jgi:hypothetical protein
VTRARASFVRFARCGLPRRPDVGTRAIRANTTALPYDFAPGRARALPSHLHPPPPGRVGPASHSARAPRDLPHRGAPARGGEGLPRLVEGHNVALRVFRWSVWLPPWQAGWLLGATGSLRAIPSRRASMRQRKTGPPTVGSGTRFSSTRQVVRLPRSLAERAENDVFRSAEFHYTKDQRWDGLKTPQMSPFGKSRSAALIERQVQVTV